MTKKYSADDIIRAKSDISPTNLADLTETGFSSNLQKVTNHALDFAKSLVTNQLRGELRYLVFQENFPNQADMEDVEFFQDEGLKYVCFDNLNDVKKVLWRSGSVPEWVNVYVSSERNEFIYIKFDCCGRYTDDPKVVYHLDKGVAPFNVLGPPIPDGFDLSSGSKYKI